MVAHIAKQILGAAVVALAGWFAAILFYEVVAFVELLQQPHYIPPGGLVVGAIVATWVMGYFIIPIWLLVLIPLYLFIPSSSPLWDCLLLGISSEASRVSVASRPKLG
jgi:hypothetical protein